MTVARGALVALTACAAPSKPSVPPLFERLSPEATGIAFANRLPESADFNILNYLYYYNGGGVAVGDVDDDGLPDLYFSANVGPNRLYRNKGNFQFEDVTDRAGVAGPPGWKTGVTMADVNGDGHVDIYASAVDHLTMHGRNVLYVNDGRGAFTDRTREYGLEHVGYSTQALFFDYDGDGDLDMYLLNHSTHTERAIYTAAQRTAGNPRASDRLYRNDAGHFTDVSEQAGVGDRGGAFGLGVVASDVNMDGCPDLYVANDFQENDYLYVNNCDGTFRESITKATGHTSRFSMGVDAADFDNDGRPDLFVADMLPEREDVFKTSASYETFNLFNLRLRAGYHPQYPRNTLQLNRGRGRFSEIGYLAGVHATDWSWAALFADLDNDGRKDLFITNGIYRRPNDLDYINYVGNEAVQAALAKGITQRELALLKRMPQIPLPNHAFHNDGNLTFSNVTDAWGLGQPGFSNGAAYVDLNNSGALDLVVNTLNAPAAVYRSRARAVNGNAYLTVRLRAGYHPQYARNTLQLNRGQARFSEIGYLAGVHASDWSWSALFADLDNDGRKDLFITNGIYRRPNDLDYINYVGNEAVQAALAKGITERELAMLKRMPQIPLPNHAFRNDGNLTFENVTDAWGLGQPGFSNGAAYVDLNNDGALDLVVNNVNAPAAIYRNRAREINGHHSLTLVLRGSGANSAGIGAKVVIK
ncbi:MAG TPA: VCBS repeat-containing protein, partial [Pyrinomonadaceae bacterium]